MDLIRKNTFFEGWPLIKFNNLELVLGMALKFYSSIVKGLKLKVRKVWGYSYVCRSYREKTGSVGHFGSPILNRVNFGCLEICTQLTYQRDLKSHFSLCLNLACFLRFLSINLVYLEQLTMKKHKNTCFLKNQWIDCTPVLVLHP